MEILENQIDIFSKKFNYKILIYSVFMIGKTKSKSFFSITVFCDCLLLYFICRHFFIRGKITIF